MTTGTAASTTLKSTGVGGEVSISLAGLTASPFTGETDLAIDSSGDLLTIDSAGDVLIVSGAVTFSGGTASLIAPDFANTLETEAWVGLETEAGQTFETEGN
jgi:hypothetical protein